MSQTYSRDSFDRFGDDLCQLLVSYLPFEESFRFECLSKQWQRSVFINQNTLIIDDNVLNKWHLNGNTASAADLMAVQLILKKCPLLTRLKMFVNSKLTQQLFEVIVNQCKRLDTISVHFGYNTNICDTTLAKFGHLLTEIFIPFPTILNAHRNSLTRLRRVRDCYMPLDTYFNDHNQLWINGLTLAEIYIKGTDHLARFPSFIAHYKHSLRSIRVNLRQTNNLSSAELVNGLLKELCQLKSLRQLSVILTCCIYFRIDQQFIHCLNELAIKCRHIKHIHFNIVDITDPEYTLLSEAMTRFKKLEVLEFKLYPIVDVDIDFDFQVRSAPVCKRLTHLSYIMTQIPFQINKSFVDSIDTNLPRLQCLKLWIQLKIEPNNIDDCVHILILNYLINNVHSSGDLTQSCLQCICKASSGCKLTTKCHNAGGNAYYCGPYQIGWAYWADAGKPGNTGRSDDFEHCLNDKNCAEVTIKGYMNKYQKDCNNDGVIDCLDFAAIHQAGASSCDKQWLYNSQYWNVFRQCHLSSSDTSQPSQPTLNDKPWPKPTPKPQTPSQSQPYSPHPWTPPQPQPQPYPNDPYNQPQPNDPWNQPQPQPVTDDSIIQPYPAPPSNAPQPRPVPNQSWNRPQTQPKPLPQPRPAPQPATYPNIPKPPPVSQPQPIPDESWDPLPPQPINNNNYNEPQPQPDPWNQPQPNPNDPYDSYNPPQPVTEDPWDEISRAVDEVARPSPKPQTQPQPQPQPPAPARDPWNNGNNGQPFVIPGRAPTQPVSWPTPASSPSGPYRPAADSSQLQPPPSPSLIEVPNNASLSDNCFECICQASSDCDLNKQCEGSYCGPYLISWAYWSDGGQPGGNYATCANDRVCAEIAVQGYMNKWQRDCNGDGAIDCTDFAAIHKLGPHSCNSEAIHGTKYWTSYQTCQSPPIDARRLEPNPSSDSLTGRSVPQSQPNANLFVEYPTSNPIKPIESRSGNTVTRDAPNYYARESRITFPRESEPNRAQPNGGNGVTTGPITSNNNNNNNKSNDRALEALGLQRECLDCICHASSKCNPGIGCQNDGSGGYVCGPYQMNWAYWSDAGKPGFRGNLENLENYQSCLNNKDCAEAAIYGFMKKHKKDCNDDGQITCYDFASLHMAGPANCNTQWFLESQYWSDFRECFDFRRRK